MRVRALFLVLAALLPVASAAQEPTNRDQSHYTQLKPEGYPIRAGVVAQPGREATLRDDDLVIGVVVGGETRAYPVNLMWEPVNEVLNDTLGGQPITATWCPIAHSAAVYDGARGKDRLELGAVGLRDGVFILYDRKTRSWWSQVAGTAVQGPLAGERLVKLASTVTTWAAWRREHPETSVWSDPSLPGRRRFTEESLSRITLAGEGPIVNQDLVVGIEGEKRSRAYLLRRLAGAGRIANDTVDDTPVVVVLEEDAVSVHAWGRRVKGRTLTFEAAGGQLLDRETRSSWDARAGRALSGPLAGASLETVVYTTALWYAWRSQRPDTTLWSTPRP
jgi:Protein of unknown function (DUF3179)